MPFFTSSCSTTISRDSSAACSKNTPASAWVFGTNADCTLLYRSGGTDLSHTQPRIFRIAHMPAIGLNLDRLVAPTTFGATTVKEHSHSSGKFMSQHITDNDLASFSRHSWGQCFQNICCDLTWWTFPVFYLAQDPLQFLRWDQRSTRTVHSQVCPWPFLRIGQCLFGPQALNGGLGRSLWELFPDSLVSRSKSSWSVYFVISLGSSLLCTLLDLGRMFSRFSALRFLQMDWESLFSTARPRCLPSLFFCSRRVLSSSSVTVISLLSIILCVFAVPKRSRGAITTQFSNLSTSLRPLFAKSRLASSHAKSLHVSTRRPSTALWSVLNQSESSTCTRLASSFFENEVHCMCAHLQDPSSCIVCTNSDLSLRPSKCSSPSGPILLLVRSGYRLCLLVFSVLVLTLPRGDGLSIHKNSHSSLHPGSGAVPVSFMKSWIFVKCVSKFPSCLSLWGNWTEMTVNCPSSSTAVHLLAPANSFRLSAPPLVYADCWTSQSPALPPLPTSSLGVNSSCAPTLPPSSFLKYSCNNKTSQSVSIEICNRKMSVESPGNPATFQLITCKVTGSVVPYDRPKPFRFYKSLPFGYCLQYPRLPLHDDRDLSNPSEHSSDILTPFVVDSMSAAS